MTAINPKETYSVEHPAKGKITLSGEDLKNFMIVHRDHFPINIGDAEPKPLEAKKASKAIKQSFQESKENN